MSELVHLDFPTDAYRDAVALVTAYSFGERDVCEVLLAGAGRDLASAFTIIVFALVGTLAELDGYSFAEELEAMGRTAARVGLGPA